MKTIVKFVSLLLMATICSAIQCFDPHEDENHHHRIYFENCWERPVFIGFGIDWYWEFDPFAKYFKHAEIPLSECDAFNKVMPGEVDSEYIYFDDYIEYMTQDRDSVYLLVYDGEQINKKDSECFLVMYLLSIEDLQKVNFHLTYPPNQDMKDFYMWPSYNDVIEQSRQSKSKESKP